MVVDFSTTARFALRPGKGRTARVAGLAVRRGVTLGGRPRFRLGCEMAMGGGEAGVSGDDDDDRSETKGRGEGRGVYLQRRDTCRPTPYTDGSSSDSSALEVLSDGDFDAILRVFVGEIARSSDEARIEWNGSLVDGVTGDHDEDAGDSVDETAVEGVWSILGETVCGSSCEAADKDIMYALEKMRPGMSWEDGSVLRHGDTGAALNMSQVIPYEASGAILGPQLPCSWISSHILAPFPSSIPACHPRNPRRLKGEMGGRARVARLTNTHQNPRLRKIGHVPMRRGSRVYEATQAVYRSRTRTCFPLKGMSPHTRTVVHSDGVDVQFGGSAARHFSRHRTGRAKLPRRARYYGRKMSDFTARK